MRDGLFVMKMSSWSAQTLATVPCPVASEWLLNSVHRDVRVRMFAMMLFRTSYVLEEVTVLLQLRQMSSGRILLEAITEQRTENKTK